MVAIHGWERREAPFFDHTTLEAVCQRFSFPLQQAGVDLPLVIEEWDDMVVYGTQSCSAGLPDCLVENLQCSRLSEVE